VVVIHKQYLRRSHTKTTIQTANLRSKQMCINITILFR